MKNSIYLAAEWFNGSAPFYASYITQIRGLGFTTHLCDVGNIDDTGNLAASGYSTLPRYARAVRNLTPGAEVLAVVGYGNRLTNTAFAGGTFIATLANSIQTLLDNCDVDGVQLDFEHFKDSDVDYLNLLKALKAGPLAGKILSIASPIIGWSIAFITQVAAVVDEICPMLYDTASADGPTYRDFVAAAIGNYSTALTDLACRFTPDFPAYEKKPAGADGIVYHDPGIENMRLAIAGANKAIAHGAHVDGASIFYGPHFMGLNPSIYTQYPMDQGNWVANWLR